MIYLQKMVSEFAVDEPSETNKKYKLTCTTSEVGETPF